MRTLLAQLHLLLEARDVLFPKHAGQRLYGLPPKDLDDLGSFHMGRFDLTAFILGSFRDKSLR